MKLNRSLAAVVCCAVIVAGAAGCSSKSDSPSSGAVQESTPTPTLSAKELWTQALTTSKAAKNVRVVGTSAPSADVLVDMDIAGTLDGKNQQGTVKMGTVLDAKFIVIDDFLYMHTPEVKTDKYVKLPVSERPEFKQFTGMLNELLNTYDQAISIPSDATVQEIDFKGTPALKLSQPDDKQTIVIDKSSHFLLQVSQKSGKDVATFSDWNQVAPASPPPADKVMNPQG